MSNSIYYHRWDNGGLHLGININGQKFFQRDPPFGQSQGVSSFFEIILKDNKVSEDILKNIVEEVFSKFSGSIEYGKVYSETAQHGTLEFCSSEKFEITKSKILDTIPRILSMT